MKKILLSPNYIKHCSTISNSDETFQILKYCITSAIDNFLVNEE